MKKRSLFINTTGMKQQYSMQGVMDIEDLVKFGEKNKYVGIVNIAIFVSMY